MSSTDRLFRDITTLQCGQIREMLQAGIEIQLIFTPARNSTAEPRGILT